GAPGSGLWPAECPGGQPQDLATLRFERGLLRAGAGAGASAATSSATSGSFEAASSMAVGGRERGRPRGLGGATTGLASSTEARRWASSGRVEENTRA